MSGAKYAIYVWVWVVLAMLSQPAWSVMYSARLDAAEWHLTPSQFECQLTQSIPYYGKAVFSRRAGEPLRFYLESEGEYMKTGRASLVIQPPVWKPSLASVSLGFVDITRGAQPIALREKTARRLLSELYKGMRPVFTRRAWYNEGESVQVALSSVSFQGAYNDYLSCLSQLLPVNYDQIKRTTFYFVSGGHQLTEASRKKLEDMMTYVGVDTDVQAFYVDGHTDEKGVRSENLVLSQQRAESVSAMLVKMGVDPGAIVTRFHGERYPVASNQTRRGRAQNRRVTIRLDKAPPVQPEVINQDAPEDPVQALLEGDGGAADANAPAPDAAPAGETQENPPVL